jgi:hypothetical protein
LWLCKRWEGWGYIRGAARHQGNLFWKLFPNRHHLSIGDFFVLSQPADLYFDVCLDRCILPWVFEVSPYCNWRRANWSRLHEAEHTAVHPMPWRLVYPRSLTICGSFAHIWEAISPHLGSAKSKQTTIPPFTWQHLEIWQQRSRFDSTLRSERWG